MPIGVRTQPPTATGAPSPPRPHHQYHHHHTHRTQILVPVPRLQLWCCAKQDAPQSWRVPSNSLVKHEFNELKWAGFYQCVTPHSPPSPSPACVHTLGLAAKYPTAHVSVCMPPCTEKRVPRFYHWHACIIFIVLPYEIGVIFWGPTSRQWCHLRA